MIRVVLKVCAFVMTVIGYVSTSLIMAFVTRDPELRKRRLSKNINRWAHYLGLRILGLKVDIHGAYDPEVFKKKNYLVLCNHLSYTDVIAISSVFPSVFVTSVEVRDSAFVGMMSNLGGSVFVERRNREHIEKEIAEITRALKEGLNVVIFPEATSSNGETVLPFKRSLLKAAIDASTLR